MPGFDFDTSPTDLISKELRNYNDEDLIWIYREALKTKTSMKHEDILDLVADRELEPFFKFKDIAHFKRFKEIRDSIFLLLEKINDPSELKIFFQKINELKINYYNKDDFHFIKNDKRLCHFSANYLFNHEIIKHNKIRIITFNFLKEPYIYVAFHFLIESRHADKNNLKIKSIKRTYENEILKKHQNNSKNISDEDFINWAYSYIKNANKIFKNNLYIPENKDERSSMITSFLDLLLCSDENSHLILTSKLFKAWSQRKFRAADKVKKPYHLPLTKVAKTELKKLSEFKNKTESEILEELIHRTYLTEMCDENGKLKYP